MGLAMKMSHVEIMVGEITKAVEFYTKALGLEKTFTKLILNILPEKQ